MIFIPIILFVVIQATAGHAYEVKNHGTRAEQRRGPDAIAPDMGYK